MNPEQQAILKVAIMAALCDGEQGESERAAIQKLSLGADLDYAQALAAAQAGKSSLSEIAGSIVTPAGKQLTLEAAIAICNADGASNAAELAFIESLRKALGLGVEASSDQHAAAALANAPLAGAPVTVTPAAVSAPAPAPDVAKLDKLIMDAAIFNGALELLPATLATMAIVPLQMKLVYRIGTAYHYELGREHVRDFVATLGLGLSAQVLEGFARKLLGGLFGGLGRQTASSGMAFVSTYAIGQAAKRYYAGGRRLEALQLRETYESMLADAKSLASKVQEEIRRRAESIRTSNIVDLVKGA
jgi:uncharacterized protein (DUF697 family)/tellurite resistance protein